MKEAQARADKAKPHVEPAAVKRKAEANAIIEAIAKKVKEAAEKAEKQKAQRRQQMFIDGAAQYIKPEYGKLSKKGKDAIKPSPKICRCHLSASGAGAHKDTYLFFPSASARFRDSDEPRDARIPGGAAPEDVDDQSPAGVCFEVLLWARSARDSQSSRQTVHIICSSSSVFQFLVQRSPSHVLVESSGSLKSFRTTAPKNTRK